MSENYRQLLKPEESLSMLYPRAEIEARITELAAEISSDYKDIATRDNPLLLLCTLRGAVFFAADLIRQITVPCEMDFLKLRSYVGVRPVGSPIFDLGEDINVEDRNVLIVEDIVDTGRTMETVIANFRDKGAGSIDICTLLDKPKARHADVQLTLKYIGFTTEPLFVVGWGLDCNDRFRTLGDIMVYHNENLHI